MSTILIVALPLVMEDMKTVMKRHNQEKQDTDMFIVPMWVTFMLQVLK